MPVDVGVAVGVAVPVPGVVVDVFEPVVPVLVGVLVERAEVPVAVGIELAEVVALVGVDVAGEVAVAVGVGVAQPPLRETVGCAWSTRTGPSGVLRLTVIEL